MNTTLSSNSIVVVSCNSSIISLQNKGSLQFEDKWDLMRPIVLKLLRQESVTKQQWFDLFS